MLLPTIKKFKEEKKIADYEFYKYLCELFERNGMLFAEQLNFIKKYCTDEDRDIFIEDDEDEVTRVYLSTSPRNADACYFEVAEGYIKIHEVKYDRVGNGKVQEGTVVSRVYTLRNWTKNNVAEVIHISNSGESTAQLLLFNNVDPTKPFPPVANAVIAVDPNTLRTIRTPIPAADEVGGAATLLRKTHIKGSNKINGKTVNFMDEDNKSLQDFQYSERPFIY